MGCRIIRDHPRHPRKIPAMRSSRRWLMSLRSACRQLLPFACSCVSHSRSFAPIRGQSPHSAFVFFVCFVVQQNSFRLRLRRSGLSVVKLNCGMQGHERIAPPGPICGNRLSRRRQISRGNLPFPGYPENSFPWKAASSVFRCGLARALQYPRHNIPPTCHCATAPCGDRQICRSSPAGAQWHDNGRSIHSSPSA